ncbi:MAG TPA: endolytic transglycosylase MltG, partial [Bacillales bacterium]|nr:endolytic transglycosylase MltG [Bacillales bacterium]
MPAFKEQDYLRKIEKKAEEARIVRRIVLIVVIAIAVLLAAAVGGGYYYVQSALKPVNPDSHKKIEVKIPLGSSVSDIAHRLDDKGIIKNAFVFHVYVKYKNENGFQAGHYLLSPSMSIDDIINKLKSGKVSQTIA